MERNTQFQEDDKHVGADSRTQHPNKINDAGSLIHQILGKRAQGFRIHDRSYKGGADTDKNSEGNKSPERRIDVGL